MEAVEASSSEGGAGCPIASREGEGGFAGTQGAKGGVATATKEGEGVTSGQCEGSEGATTRAGAGEVTDSVASEAPPPVEEILVVAVGGEDEGVTAGGGADGEELAKTIEGAENPFEMSLIARMNPLMSHTLIVFGVHTTMSPERSSTATATTGSVSFKRLTSVSLPKSQMIAWLSWPPLTRIWYAVEAARQVTGAR